MTVVMFFLTFRKGPRFGDLLRSTCEPFRREKEREKLETGVATANKPINARTCTIIFTHSKMHKTKLIGT